jgi:hypothetical protein
MKYPCFRISQGLTALANYSESNNSIRVDPEMRVVQGESAHTEVEVALSLLADQVTVDEAERLSSAQTHDQVEGVLSLALYQSLRDISPQALGDPGFWRFVAVDTLRGFVYWRDGENCSHASFGLKSERRIPDCVPLRMFNRAHLALRIAGNLGTTDVQVATTGGADFWQSHVLRVQNRFDPRIVGFLAGAMADGSIPNVGVLREVAKEVRQIRSNVVLELIEEDRLARVLKESM